LLVPKTEQESASSTEESRNALSFAFMTAEIGILNKNAVALAADSAVTLQHPEAPKIYNTNKLFTLSKHRPVGVMIYGSAEFMGVPWETIVKTYRAVLGRRSYATLDGYLLSFLRFVRSNRDLFSSDSQRRHAFLYATWLGTRIRDQINEELQKSILKSGSLKGSDVRSVTARVVKAYETFFRRQRACLLDLKGVPIDTISSRYKREFTDAIDLVFEQLPIQQDRRRLLNIFASGMRGHLRREYSSGVILAGYGDNEYFPSLRCFDCESVINDRLRFRVRSEKSGQITTEETAQIISFAQDEMVYRFMDGIDPRYRREVYGFLSTLLEELYPEEVAKHFGSGWKTTQRTNATKKLKKLGSQIVTAFRERMGQLEVDLFSNPIMATVAALPKDELAALAEALVNLTSLKRRISVETESVGGPIDVAVISRGDGFVWIKRKHYFKLELNPGFVRNYYEES
jgi:hypothetical protein